jgi:hypothetical protein
MLVSGTSGPDVARRIGCSASTLYRHVPGRAAAWQPPAAANNANSIGITPIIGRAANR